MTCSRVCTLKAEDLEIPSDWRGVVDEPFDASGGWKQTLARSSPHAKDFFAQLKAQKDAIEKELGYPLEWEELSEGMVNHPGSTR